MTVSLVKFLSLGLKHNQSINQSILSTEKRREPMVSSLLNASLIPSNFISTHKITTPFQQNFRPTVYCRRNNAQQSSASPPLVQILLQSSLVPALAASLAIVFCSTPGDDFSSTYDCVSFKKYDLIWGSQIACSIVLFGVLCLYWESEFRKGFEIVTVIYVVRKRERWNPRNMETEDLQRFVFSVVLELKFVRVIY